MFWVQLFNTFLAQESILGLSLQTLGLFSDFNLQFREQDVGITLNRLGLVCVWLWLTRCSNVVVDQADGLVRQNALLTAHMGWVLQGSL